MKKGLILSLMTKLIFLTGCGDYDPEKYKIESSSRSSSDIVSVATKAGQFNTLAKALQAAGLIETLKGQGPFTVFAPTDTAFSRLPSKTLQDLLNNPAALKKILLYHVVSGRVSANQVLGLTSAKTVEGRSVNFRVEHSELYVNDAKIIQADVSAANGIIHVIDTVLIPKEDIISLAEANGNFKTLLAAIQAAGLTETLKGQGPFTVFAPTDVAFAKLPAGTIEALLKDIPKLRSILLYHVVSGRVPSTQAKALTSAPTLQGQNLAISSFSSYLFINNNLVSSADNNTSNGVIHVIDSVLMPK